MTDVLSQAERDACAREAVAAIEAALDRRGPGIRIAFWAAVERLYRRDREPDAARAKSPDGAPPAQPGTVSP